MCFYLLLTDVLRGLALCLPSMGLRCTYHRRLLGVSDRRAHRRNGRGARFISIVLLTFPPVSSLDFAVVGHGVCCAEVNDTFRPIETLEIGRPPAVSLCSTTLLLVLTPYTHRHPHRGTRSSFPILSTQHFSFPARVTAHGTTHVCVRVRVPCHPACTPRAGASHARAHTVSTYIRTYVSLTLCVIVLT